MAPIYRGKQQKNRLSYLRMKNFLSSLAYTMSEDDGIVMMTGNFT